MTEPFQNNVVVVVGTQKIIVDQTGNVSVVNAGPPGPPGAPGTGGNGNGDNYSPPIPISDVNGLQTALDTKLTSVQVASLIDIAIASLVDSSPELLNTLNELAQALNNDPNFATTITDLISEKTDLAQVASALVPGTNFTIDWDAEDQTITINYIPDAQHVVVNPSSFDTILDFEDDDLQKVLNKIDDGPVLRVSALLTDPLAFGGTYSNSSWNLPFLAALPIAGPRSLIGALAPGDALINEPTNGLFRHTGAGIFTKVRSWSVEKDAGRVVLGTIKLGGIDYLDSIWFYTPDGTLAYQPLDSTSVETPSAARRVGIIVDDAVYFGGIYSEENDRWTIQSFELAPTDGDFSKLVVLGVDVDDMSAPSVGVFEHQGSGIFERLETFDLTYSGTWFISMVNLGSSMGSGVCWLYLTQDQTLGYSSLQTMPLVWDNLINIPSKINILRNFVRPNLIFSRYHKGGEAVYPGGIELPNFINPITFEILAPSYTQQNFPTKLPFHDLNGNVVSEWDYDGKPVIDSYPWQGGTILLGDQADWAANGPWDIYEDNGVWKAMRPLALNGWAGPDTIVEGTPFWIGSGYQHKLKVGSWGYDGIVPTNVGHRVNFHRNTAVDSQYLPQTPLNWNPLPLQTQEALDYLAARTKTLENQFKVIVNADINSLAYSVNISGYSFIRYRFLGRSSRTTSTIDNLAVRFNNDAGNNYAVNAAVSLSGPPSQQIVASQTNSNRRSLIVGEVGIGLSSDTIMHWTRSGSISSTSDAGAVPSSGSVMWIGSRTTPVTSMELIPTTAGASVIGRLVVEGIPR